MRKKQDLIRMSYNADIRIIRHFIRVMRKYFPDKQISGFYFAALYRDIPLLEYWNEKKPEHKKLCFQKILKTTRKKLIIDHTIHPGGFGVYFVGFGEPLDEAVEVILSHYFFYRYVLETNDILKKIRAIKGYNEGHPYGQLAFKFLHEYNEND